MPTEDALGGACKQILDRSEGLAVSLAVVAPLAVDRDLCWARVRARGAGDVARRVVIPRRASSDAAYCRWR